MSVQIIITGDNGRQAAVELRSFTDNVADLFRAEGAAPAAEAGPANERVERLVAFMRDSVRGVIATPRRNLPAAA